MAEAHQHENIDDDDHPFEEALDEAEHHEGLSKKEKKKIARQEERAKKANRLLASSTSGHIATLTEEEKGALEEMRKRFPFRQASDPLYPVGPKDDRELLRFLRARQFNVEKAAKMLADNIKWRTETRPDLVAMEEVKSIYLGRGSIINGKDLGGRPIIFVDLSKHDPKKHDEHTLSSFRSLETLIANLEGEHERFTAVFDLSNYSRKNNDLKWATHLIGSLQAYYPERLAAAVLCNASWVFSLLWKIIKPFLDKKTADKIVFIGGGKEAALKKLQLYCGIDNIPEELGGSLKFDAEAFVQSEIARDKEEGRHGKEARQAIIRDSEKEASKDKDIDQMARDLDKAMAAEEE